MRSLNVPNARQESAQKVRNGFRDLEIKRAFLARHCRMEPSMERAVSMLPEKSRTEVEIPSSLRTFTNGGLTVGSPGGPDWHGERGFLRTHICIFLSSRWFFWVDGLHLDIDNFVHQMMYYEEIIQSTDDSRIVMDVIISFIEGIWINHDLGAVIQLSTWF